MTTHWFSLFIGLILGCIPPRLLLNCECRYLSFEELWYRVLRPPLGEGRRRRWWKLPLVWIDPLRGFAAAWMLSQAFEAAPDATGLMRHLPAALGCGLLLVAVWVQTIGRSDQRETLSPGPFLAGLLFGLLHPGVALAALIMGVVGAMAIRAFAIGYIAAICTLVGVGYIFMGKNVLLLGAIGAVSLPLLLNWFHGTRLVMPVRC